jgi:hypothetical protein
MMDNRGGQNNVCLHPERTAIPPHFIEQLPVPGANQTKKKKQEAKLYLEGLAVAATLTELLDYALELYRAEAVAGPGRPQLDLRHQERSRVAKRIQRGLQTQRPRRPWLVRAILARICGADPREEAGEEPAPAAAKAEQAARRHEEGGHRVVGQCQWGLPLYIKASKK